MQYIIIGIIGIIVIFTLGANILAFLLTLLLQCLFHPKVNSIISLIFFLSAGLMSLQSGPGLRTVLIGILIVDCILDIVRSYNYYTLPYSHIDKLYLIKSLTALLTFGYSRIIFRLIVGPVLSRSVLLDIRRKIAAGQPFSGPDSSLQAKKYYYAKHIRRMEQQGTVVYNADTINIERNVILERLRNLYPKNLMEKLAEKFSGDSDTADTRKALEQRLNNAHYSYAYLSAATFARFAQLIPEVMQAKACYSPSDIKNFEELSALNLTVPFGGSTDWSEYFIIQALQPLVADGTFMDNDISDGVDNHAYQHMDSAKHMPSIDADNDPLFALDNDD